MSARSKLACGHKRRAESGLCPPESGPNELYKGKWWLEGISLIFVSSDVKQVSTVSWYLNGCHEQSKISWCCDIELPHAYIHLTGPLKTQGGSRVNKCFKAQRASMNGICFLFLATIVAISGYFLSVIQWAGRFQLFPRTRSTAFQRYASNIRKTTQMGDSHMT